MWFRAARLVAALGVTLLVAAPAALAGNGGIAPPESATESGRSINELYWILIAVLGVIFILVEGAIIFFIVRFRRRRGTAENEDGAQIHGNTRLELAWTAIPLLILVALIVVTIVKVPSVQASPAPEAQPLVVHVDGHQFYWEYVYEGGSAATVGTVVLPVGRPVQLVIDARDVIHSWWVPEITGKLDAIPGRTNTLNFTIDRPGTYRGQCAELCGVQHAMMYTTVRAVSAEEFDAWLADRVSAQVAGTSELGKETWEGVCATCHGALGEGVYGPMIAGNSTLGDATALSTLLMNGQNSEALPGYMPPVSTGWPEGQLEALIAYIASNPDLAPAGQAAQQGG